jgi:hypothetical protein
VQVSYYRFTLGGLSYPVLSRVAFYGMDYTGRSNKLAHHVVLQTEEMIAAGPAAMALHQPTFITEWKSEPKLFNAPRRLDAVAGPTGIASYWLKVVGDAGWAGAMAEHTLGAPDATVALLFSPEAEAPDMLRLLAECMMLIPPEKRWEITFSTYLTDMPTGTTCRWRCVIAGSAEWEKIRRAKNLLVLDFTKRPWEPAADSPLVEAARRGDVVHPQATARAPAAAPALASGDYEMAPNAHSRNRPDHGPSLSDVEKLGHGKDLWNDSVSPRKGRKPWMRWTIAAGAMLVLGVGAAATVFWLKRSRDLGQQASGNAQLDSAGPTATAGHSGATTEAKPIVTSDNTKLSQRDLPPEPTTLPELKIVPVKPIDAPSTSVTKVVPLPAATSPAPTPNTLSVSKVIEVPWRGPAPSADAPAIVRLFRKVNKLGRWHTYGEKRGSERPELRVNGVTMKTLRVRLLKSDALTSGPLQINVEYESSNLASVSFVTLGISGADGFNLVNDSEPIRNLKDLKDDKLKEELLCLMSLGRIELHSGKRKIAEFEFAGLADLKSDSKIKEGEAAAASQAEKEHVDKFNELDRDVKQMEAWVAEVSAAGSNAEIQADWRKRLRDAMKMPVTNDEEEKSRSAKLENLDKSISRLLKGNQRDLLDKVKKTLGLEDRITERDAQKLKRDKATSNREKADAEVASLKTLHAEVMREQSLYLPKK